MIRKKARSVIRPRCPCQISKDRGNVLFTRYWEALKRVLGRPAWADDPALATLAGRRAAHDRIDAGLRSWFAERDRDKQVDELIAAGVPAAPVADPRTASAHPQHGARRFFEEFEHPVVGTHPAPTLPFTYTSVDRWLRTPAPTLGQHNEEILGDLLGLDDEAIAALAADGVIGNRPLRV